MVQYKIQSLALVGIAVNALFASVQVASAGTPARGYIDARWNSGYVVRGQDHHPCGHFAICPGCSRLTPNSYRRFAPLVVPEPREEQLGGSWYTGNPWSTASPAPAPVSPAADEIAPGSVPQPEPLGSAPALLRSLPAVPLTP